MSGKIRWKGQLHATCVLVYVDDILVCSTCPEAHLLIQEALLKVVTKVKITGECFFEKGGTLTFLGRELTRKPHGEQIFLRVPTDYLRELVQDLAPSPVPPNILQDLEKSTPELSSEEASIYRSQLGRLSWWMQSRPDMLRFSSLLAQGQSKPTQSHMHALKRILRFVKSQLHLYQSFPSTQLSEYPAMTRNNVPQDQICVFSDASWGALESEQRRSCSGYVLTWRHCVLKCVSKLQICIALSSCEAETVALLQAAQEALGLSKLIEFVKSLGESMQIKNLLDIDMDKMQYDGSPIVFMITDSSSARDVLLGEGLSRKVRHLSIAVYFFQNHIKQGIIQLAWAPGKEQLGDGLTKILSREGVERIREVLGFIEMSGPEKWQHEKLKPGKKSFSQSSFVSQFSEVNVGWLEDLREFRRVFKNGSKWVLIIELCANKKSGLRPCHLSVYHKLTFFVLQIDEADDIIKCGEDLLCELKVLSKHSQFGIVAWFSPPCIGGSKALDAADQRKFDSDSNLVDIVRSSQELIRFANVRCVEMSRACSFWKWQLVRCLVEEMNLSSTSYFSRCAYDETPGFRANHVYRVQANIPLECHRICSCEKHQIISHQNAVHLDMYPKPLAREICRAIAKQRLWTSLFAETSSY